MIHNSVVAEVAPRTYACREYGDTLMFTTALQSKPIRAIAICIQLLFDPSYAYTHVRAHTHVWQRPLHSTHEPAFPAILRITKLLQLDARRPCAPHFDLTASWCRRALASLSACGVGADHDATPNRAHNVNPIGNTENEAAPN